MDVTLIQEMNHQEWQNFVLDEQLIFEYIRLGTRSQIIWLLGIKF